MKETETDSAVTLFVVPHCPLCTRARAWLAQHEITYVERDVKQNFGALRDMVRLTNQLLVPVFARGERALVRPTDDELTEFLVDRK